MEELRGISLLGTWINNGRKKGRSCYTPDRWFTLPLSTWGTTPWCTANGVDILR
jgi:hypothetical protein